MENYNIYFDCAATVKPYQEALDSFNNFSLKYFANDSSTHKLGFESKKMLEKARGQIAKYLNVKDSEIIFTSGATESNNMAIRQIAYHCKSWANKLITSKIEHPSVLNVFKQLENEGFIVNYIDIQEDGSLNFNQLEKCLDNKTSLVSIMSVNNETGLILPIDKIYKLVKEKSHALFHTDATQAIGKEKIDSLSYDLLSFSGHKIGAVKSTGVLVKKENVTLTPLIIGGGQENGYRSGTTPLAQICSLATALRISINSQKQRYDKASEIKNYLIEKLSEIEEVKITSLKNSTPFILSFSLLKHKGSVVAEALSECGIYVSTKSACSERSSSSSYVLENIYHDRQIAENGIRLSFSGTETQDECEIFIDVLKKILNQIKLQGE